jgi:uncharacterized protein
MTGYEKYIRMTRDIVLSIIDKEIVTVFLFGSRAGKDFKHGSDLDIGFISNKKLEGNIFSRINEAVEKSFIPYHVDLIDFGKVDENFRRIALEKIEIWNKAKD